MLTISSCSKEEKIQELIFVGDSHVERWDLPISFPSYICHNYGQSGSGIEYLLSRKSITKDKDIVVVTGRNDLSKLDGDSLQSYAKHYVRILSSLSARNMYVFSIFPCSKKVGGVDDADRINMVNCYIRKELLSVYPKAIYVDVYSDFMLDGELNPQYSADGLHLNYCGYLLLSHKLLMLL